MKRSARFALNVAANLCVLALSPFLVLAWLVRVRLKEAARARRGSPGFMR